MSKHPDRKTLQTEVSDHLKESITLLSIGNHQLKRHQVYRVLAPDQPDRILKYHYLPETFLKEHSALNTLESSGLPMPRLLWTHRYPDGRGLILMSQVPGIILSTASKRLNTQELVPIFQAIGAWLGKLHSCRYSLPAGGKLPAQKQLDRLKHIMTREMPNTPEIQYALAHMKEDLASALKEQQDDLQLQLAAGKAQLWPMCHLDLDARNCMVQLTAQGYQFSGVIDFEHTEPFEASADFANLWRHNLRKQPELFKATVAGYRQYHPEFTPSAEFHRALQRQLLLQCISGLSWSKDLAPNYFEECQQSLQSFYKTRR